jgi:flagellin-like protein
MNRFVGRHRFGNLPRGGVSPLIATILLVAIAVILAAVLFVMVSQLSRVGDTTQIGTLFYAGPATETVGTASTTQYCQTGLACYSVPISLAAGGLSLGSVNFRVVTSSDSPHIVTKNFAKISILDSTNRVLADSQVKKNSPFVVTSWQTYGPGVKQSTPLSDLQVIWVQFGSPAYSPVGQGLTLQILGVGSYSGVVDVSLP